MGVIELPGGPSVPIGQPGSGVWVQHFPEPHMYNKIRYFLEAANRSEGMQATHGVYTTFYDGMALNIPNYYTIWIQGTDEFLRQYPSYTWKNVIIWKTEPDFQQQLRLMRAALVDDFIDNIPVFGPILVDIHQGPTSVQHELMMEQLTSVTYYPVWENLLYKHTLANKILHANPLGWTRDIVPYLQRKYPG